MSTSLTACCSTVAVVTVVRDPAPSRQSGASSGGHCAQHRRHERRWPLVLQRQPPGEGGAQAGGDLQSLYFNNILTRWRNCSPWLTGMVTASSARRSGSGCCSARGSRSPGQYLLDILNATFSTQQDIQTDHSKSGIKLTISSPLWTGTLTGGWL